MFYPLTERQVSTTACGGFEQNLKNSYALSDAE
jgi:hypothetical protein